MSKLIIVTSVALDEPVILNRLIPLISVAKSSGLKCELVGASFSDIKVAEKLIETDVELFLHKSAYASKSSNVFFRLMREVYISFRIGQLHRKRLDERAITVVTIPSMFLPIMMSRKLEENSLLTLDIRDLTWEYLIGSSFSGSVIGKLVRWLNRKAVRKFDSITVTNKSELEYLVQHFNVDEKHIQIIPNGVSESQFRSLSKINSSLIEKKDKSVTVSYIGNVGIAQSFQEILSIAKMHSNILVRIVGSGARITEVHNSVDKHGLSNVEVTGRVAWNEVLNYYEKTDILFASLATGYQSAIPSKLYEYLAVGKPVVFLGEIDSRDIFDDFEGIYFCRSDTNELNALILEISQRGPLSEKTISRNRQILSSAFIREDNWELFVKKSEMNL